MVVGAVMRTMVVLVVMMVAGAASASQESESWKRKESVSESRLGGAD